VVVGTPGRVMDHMKRGTLDLSGLSFLVLDEADEMLQRGFIDDIEWILEQTPVTRQVALFSATLPAAIRRIAQKHLRSPAEITIQSKTSTAANIRQRYWLVSGLHKLDALTRILEAESFDAMLVFVRTKLETVDLAERLQARGFDAAALNGDIPQQQRERTINALKSGKVDIVVATDVAARGLDVDRISHVVNYDVPYDSESYIHRIGRTGRAGRSGEAILFIAPRERNMLRIIERATRQQIEQMSLPSIADVNEQRVAKFKQRITAAIEAGESAAFRELIEEIERERNVPALDIAAALASLLQGGAPLLLPERADEQFGRAEIDKRQSGGRRGVSEEEARGGPRRGGRAEKQERRKEKYGAREGRRERFEAGGAHPGQGERVESGGGHRAGHEQLQSGGARRREQIAPTGDLAELAEGQVHLSQRGHAAHGDRHESPTRRKPGGPHQINFETFRVEVGHVHGVKPGNIVGAIANEAGLEGRHIGHVDIHEDHSFVDLPEGMPKEIFRSLKKVRVVGRELQIAHARKSSGDAGGRKPHRSARQE
jgi:ATP-dependent RNA helicase DeaD